jgi:Cu2+-exporting ATPase
LATPATLVAAAGGLARRGVLLRRLDTLQAMASVRQVFLDKTGTLTEDRLVLRQVRILNPGLGLSAAQAAARALADVQALGGTGGVAQVVGPLRERCVQTLGFGGQAVAGAARDAQQLPLGAEQLARHGQAHAARGAGEDGDVLGGVHGFRWLQNGQGL